MMPPVKTPGGQRDLYARIHGISHFLDRLGYPQETVASPGAATVAPTTALVTGKKDQFTVC
ncbi:MAG: hypothetical protein ACTSYO_08435 [Candidatus Ranarchaeia archaeon]